MGPAPGTALVAASAQLHGTAWLGVAGAAVGLGAVVVAMVRARRRLAVGGAVAASAVVLVAIVAVFGGSLVVIPAVLVGLLAVGALAGWLLGADRRCYLTAAAGCLLVALFGEVVFLPSGEQWSGDLFALGAVPIVAALVWLPIAIGAWIAAPEPDDLSADESLQRGDSAT